MRMRNCVEMGKKEEESLFNGEETLFDVVLKLFAEESLCRSRNLVLESRRLDRASVYRECVVVEKLLVDVRSEGSGGYALCLAHLRPGAKMLVVSDLRSTLEVNECSRRDECAVEPSLDAKDALEDLADLLLCCVVLVREVEERARSDVLGAVPHSSDDIAHMDSVVTQIASPHELHLLAEVLVHRCADHAGSETSDVARSVDSSRTQNDERKTSDGLEVLLSLQVDAGDGGPGLELAVFSRRLLAGSVDLGSAQMDELLRAGVEDDLLGDLHADVVELFLVDRLVLAVLRLGCAVEHIVKAAPVVQSKALLDRSGRRKVALHELHNGVREHSSVRSVQERSLREHLINCTHKRHRTGVHKILHKVAANETCSTKNKNSRHYPLRFNRDSQNCYNDYK